MSFIQEYAEERDIKISKARIDFDLKVWTGLTRLLSKRVKIKTADGKPDREILVTEIKPVNECEAIAQVLDQAGNIYNIHEDTEVTVIG